MQLTEKVKWNVSESSMQLYEVSRMEVTEVLLEHDWSLILLEPSSQTDPQGSGRNTAVLSASFS